LPSLSNQNNLSDSIKKWVQDCPKRSAPNHNVRYRFQIKYCGLEEIRVRDGGEEIWADGIDLHTGQLLEAKFIEHPANSPYVSNSNIPPFIRAKIIGEVENEFRRYGLIINDKNTPFMGLRVIVNRPEALPFFTELLTRFNISGLVVVKS
jgi:hypothetical protein